MYRLYRTHLHKVVCKKERKPFSWKYAQQRSPRRIWRKARFPYTPTCRLLSLPAYWDPASHNIPTSIHEIEIPHWILDSVYVNKGQLGTNYQSPITSALEGETNMSTSKYHSLRVQPNTISKMALSWWGSTMPLESLVRGRPTGCVVSYLMGRYSSSLFASRIWKGCQEYFSSFPDNHRSTIRLDIQRCYANAHYLPSWWYGPKFFVEPQKIMEARGLEAESSGIRISAYPPVIHWSGNFILARSFKNVVYGSSNCRWPFIFLIPQYKDDIQPVSDVPPPFFPCPLLRYNLEFGIFHTSL